MLALAAGVAFWWIAWRLPGAGSLHQYAPDRVVAGQEFDIIVRAGVWGSGGAAHQRYAGMRLQLLLDGQPLGSEVVPVATSRVGEQAEFRFRLRAPHGDVMTGRAASAARVPGTAVSDAGNRVGRHACAGTTSSTGPEGALDWCLRFVFDGQAQQASAPRPVMIDR